MRILRKIPAMILVCVMMSMHIFTFASIGSVIYKDITSISIKTIINFDYENFLDNGLPEIEIFDKYNEDGDEMPEADDHQCIIYTANTRYYIESAEWYDNTDKEFAIGGQPQIVVYLATKDAESHSDRDYYNRFLSSYSQSTCYISNGNFVSGQRQSYDLVRIVFKLKPIKGTYEQPENAFWADEYGTAQWYPPQENESGYYDLALYRDDALVARVSKYHGESYNFYSYMTRTGNYVFKVKTVGGTDNQAAYGKSSEYVESNSFMVDEYNKYDPTKGASNYGGANIPGQQITNPAQIGWIQQNNKWYFIRPDGQMVKNGWIDWKGKWYYLTSDGSMATGWLEKNGFEYYLQSDGAMLVGWLSSGNTYFYFSDIEGQTYGAQCKNTFVQYNGKFFYFDENGIMVTGWRQIKDANGNTGFYYFYQNGEVEGLFGYMASNTYINGFYIGADGKWAQQ